MEKIPSDELYSSDCCSVIIRKDSGSTQLQKEPENETHNITTFTQVLLLRQCFAV